LTDHGYANLAGIGSFYCTHQNSRIAEDANVGVPGSGAREGPLTPSLGNDVLLAEEPAI